MAQIKLYTEEQVKITILRARAGFVSDEKIINSLTPIELPSDEEIVKKAKQEPNNLEITEGIRIGYIAGAKWIIKQIINQNK